MIDKTEIQDYIDDIAYHGWTPFKFRRGWKKWIVTSTPFNLDGIIQWFVEIQNIEYTCGLTFMRISPSVAHVVQVHNEARESRI